MKEWFRNNKKSIIITAVVVLTLAASFFLVGQPKDSAKKTTGNISYSQSIGISEKKPVSESEGIQTDASDANSEISKSNSEISITEKIYSSVSLVSGMGESSVDDREKSVISEPVSSEIIVDTSTISDNFEDVGGYELSEVPYTTDEHSDSIVEESIQNEKSVVSRDSSVLSKSEESSSAQNSDPSQDTNTSVQESSQVFQPSQKNEETSVKLAEADVHQEECIISISCENLLDNMENLKKNKRSIVPADGVILKETRVTVNSGDSVFDITKRICTENMIPFEFTLTPVYNTAYVEGIYNLYEFDCGSGSGWMYTVNGTTPSVGCSDYHVNDGDVIHWYYTCNMGHDGE